MKKLGTSVRGEHIVQLTDDEMQSLVRVARAVSTKTFAETNRAVFGAIGLLGEALEDHPECIVGWLAEKLGRDESGG